MIEIRETMVFSVWLGRLNDRVAKAKIAARLRRFAFGNPADVQPIGGGLSELRINHGPGYRIYIVQKNETLVILLCGGDKGTQRRDIAKARTLAKTLEA